MVGEVSNKADIRISWPALMVLQATSNHRLHSGMFSCRYFFSVCHVHIVIIMLCINFSCLVF